MEQDGARVTRSRDLERLLTFVDAVVAIAITLLVLPLVDIAQGISPRGSVNALLREHSVQLLAFGLSFAVIASFWLAQHRALRTVAVQDRGVTLLLLAWTATVVFLPFPTALVATAGSQATTKLLYIGTMVVASVVLALLSMHVARTPSLRDSSEGPPPDQAWANAALFVVALGLSLLVPRASYYPMLLLTLDGVVTRAWRRLLAWSRRGGARDRRIRTGGDDPG